MFFIFHLTMEKRNFKIHSQAHDSLRTNSSHVSSCWFVQPVDDWGSQAHVAQNTGILLRWIWATESFPEVHSRNLKLMLTLQQHTFRDKHLKITFFFTENSCEKHQFGRLCHCFYLLISAVKMFSFLYCTPYLVLILNFNAMQLQFTFFCCNISSVIYRILMSYCGYLVLMNYN